MKRCFILLLAMLFYWATQAMNVYSGVCPYLSDYSYSSISIPSVSMVYVPIKTSVGISSSFESSAGSPYTAREMYSIGKSLRKGRSSYVYNGGLLSEIGFSSTSHYRQNEMNYEVAGYYIDGAAFAVSIKKAPPGKGGPATGEWLPMTDGWYFLSILALAYGCVVGERHRRQRKIVQGNQEEGIRSKE